MIKSVTQHSYFGKETRQVDGQTSKQPINQLPNIHIYILEKKLHKQMGRLQNNPSISYPTFIFWRRNSTRRWVDFKTTHQSVTQHSYFGEETRQVNGQTSKQPINQLPNIHILEKKLDKQMGRLQNNPSISYPTFIFWKRNSTSRWVDFKTTHQFSYPTFIFWRRNSTSRWVDFKTTHQLEDGCHPKSTHACPIAWGN